MRKRVKVVDILGKEEVARVYNGTVQLGGVVLHEEHEIRIECAVEACPETGESLRRLTPFWSHLPRARKPMLRRSWE